MSKPDDEEWTICYGYRVGSATDIDVLDPDFKPIVLRCPGCGENAWFSETILKSAWERSKHRPELAPIPICLDCVSTQIGWDNLPPDVHKAHLEALAQHRAEKKK